MHSEPLARAIFLFGMIFCSILTLLSEQCVTSCYAALAVIRSHPFYTKEVCLVGPRKKQCNFLLELRKYYITISASQVVWFEMTELADSNL